MDHIISFKAIFKSQRPPTTKQCFSSSLVAQRVKSLALSLLGHRFDPGLGTSTCCDCGQKKKKKKKKERKREEKISVSKSKYLKKILNHSFEIINEINYSRYWEVFRIEYNIYTPYQNFWNISCKQEKIYCLKQIRNKKQAIFFIIVIFF